ncbi:universal stress protein [Aestuariibaculum suncheonense]|uniref:Universal stress protein n=1 Tax=Aestuariibaculum suncheonense TaxID=1028745 RepID=A0A8J6QQD5_9FLAO|nr:universal stress protein [Aestuariibaculum suncheonense]MBD0834609.1 universal stress protein [Aestuariibaculum suncheonense]
MKTYILAANSFDEDTNYINHAFQMAKKTGARLVFFHLHNISIHAINARLPYESILETIKIAKDKADAFVTNLEKKYQVQTTLDFALGDFYQQLQRSIKEHQAVLLVMGIHKKYFEENLLGSTTTNTIHKVDIPVLTVPETYTYNPLKKILFAFDIERGLPAEALKKIETIAKAYKSVVEIFYVNDNPSDNKQDLINNMKASLQSTGDTRFLFNSVTSNTVVDEVKKELTRFEANLLVMVPYEYGFWLSLIHRSKTNLITSNLEVPLLTLHSNDVL